MVPIYIDKRQQMYIQFNNIKKSFDGNTVLDVENLQIEKGGKLSDTFIGKIIGVGNGRGIGLLFVICGSILLIICVMMLLNKNINQLEELNPDVIND